MKTKKLEKKVEESIKLQVEKLYEAGKIIHILYIIKRIT